MDNAVQFEWVEGQYALVTLNRADKRNALTGRMADRLKDILTQAAQMPIKCLVLTGAGQDVFCAGGDLNDLHADLTVDEAFSALYPMKEVLYELAAFPVPTICLLNGDAYGGGCELATACDFRIAKSDVGCGFVQSRIGIAPGWGGATLLYQKIHANSAYHWLVSGEVRDVTKLQATGWIHGTYQGDAANNPTAILEPYLARSIEQMQLFKRQFKASVSMLSLSAQMNEDVRDCSRLWGNPVHKQALLDFHQK